MISKYDEIKQYLKEEALKPASRKKMPTTRELMKRFGASQSPVSRAIRDLQDEGIIVCRQGSGIVSCGNSKQPEINAIETDKSFKNILFIYVDFFAENLWNMQHTVNSYGLQQNCKIINCRVQQGDDLKTIIDNCMEDTKLEGIIMLLGADRISGQVIDYLGTLKIRIIMLDSNFDYQERRNNITQLMADTAEGGRLCAEELYKAGHRKIAYIRNEPETNVTETRVNAIAAFCREHGMELSVFTSSVRSWEDSMEASCKVTLENMSAIKEKEISGIIYTSVNGAFAAIRPLRQAGFRIPEDISLIACSDGLHMRYCDPPLSIANADYIQMSRDALDIITGLKKSSQCILYPYKSEIRKSIAIR